MLAYVLDNQVSVAFDGVCNEMAAKRARLKMKASRPLTKPSSALRGWAYSADTVHGRKDGEFRLYHLLVGVK
jgi:hypothetical protein